jgi:hypothetical protein
MAGCVIPQMDLIATYGGEIEPSNKGHEGAGGFSSEVLCLQANMAGAKF